MEEQIIRKNNFKEWKSDWNDVYKDNQGKYCLCLICLNCSREVHLIGEREEFKNRNIKCKVCGKDMITFLGLIKGNSIVVDMNDNPNNIIKED